MTDLPPGTRVLHAMADNPPAPADVGTVAEIEAWDEDPPLGESPGTRTRVEWDTGIRDWVHTADLTVIPGEENPT